MQLQLMCNSILLTLEALINLLKEIKTIDKNLDKIRAREGERADQREVVVDAWGRRRRLRRSSSTHEEVTVDALLLNKELIAGGGHGGRINYKGKSSSKWEVATGGSTLCELLRHCRALGALIPQEDRRSCELWELQIKLGLRELRLVAVSIESFFVRFGSFDVAAGGSRMRIN